MADRTELLRDAQAALIRVANEPGLIAGDRTDPDSDQYELMVTIGLLAEYLEDE